MTNSVAGISQRTAARLAGCMYLLAMPTASFSVYYVWPRINVPNDAALTASNLVASEQLFRVGVLGDLITWAVDIVLILALYVLLKPVNRHLALLATFWRILETSVLCVATLGGLVALLVLSDADYLKAFETSQLQALARLALSAEGVAYNVGLIFLGLGSTVFSYLFLRSGYVPRALAAWGILASLVLLTGCLSMVVFPAWRDVLNPAYFAPIFIYELTMGFWLALKGAGIESSSRQGA